MSKSDYAAVSRLLLRVYVFEAGLGVIAFALYKMTAFTPALLASRSGIFLLAGLVVAALGAAPLVGALLHSRRALWLAIAANALSILLAFGVAESALRLAVKSSPDGISVARRASPSDLVRARCPGPRHAAVHSVVLLTMQNWGGPSGRAAEVRTASI